MSLPAQEPIPAQEEPRSKAWSISDAIKKRFTKDYWTTGWKEFFEKHGPRLAAGAFCAALIAAGFVLTGPISAALISGGLFGQLILRGLSAGWAGLAAYNAARALGASKQKSFYVGAGVGVAVALFIPAAAHAATEAIAGVVIGEPKVLTRLGSDPFVDNAKFPPGQGVVEALKDGNVTKAVNLLGEARGWTPEQRAGYIKFFTENREDIIKAMSGLPEDNEAVAGASVTKPTRMLMVDGPNRGGYGASEVLLVPTKADGFFGVEVKVPTYDASGKVVGYDKFFIPRDCNNYSYLGNEPVVPSAEPPAPVPRPVYEYKPGCDCLLKEAMNVPQANVDAVPVMRTSVEFSREGLVFGDETVHKIDVAHAPQGIDAPTAVRAFIEHTLPELRAQGNTAKHFLVFVDMDGNGVPETVLCVSETSDGTIEVGGIDEFNTLSDEGKVAWMKK